MIDVTQILENFQTLIVAIARSLADANLHKGSDQWEGLTELAFDALVVTVISDRFSCQVIQGYEEWGSSNREICVRVKKGSAVLIGTKVKASDRTFEYRTISEVGEEIEFKFVEFGNPCLEPDDMSSLEYVSGLDENERVICVKRSLCTYFVDE